MSLSTGKKSHTFNLAELPINDYVIDRVEEMEISANQPTMTNGYPIFEWYSVVSIIYGHYPFSITLKMF